MGYGSYVLPDGREAGYHVEAVCDEPGCEEVIDRGLGHLCGDSPLGLGLNTGCGGYFCGEHHFPGCGKKVDGHATSACGRCADEAEKAEPVPAS